MRVHGVGVNAEFKYKDAISLYADSGLSIKEICKQTGVGFSAFSSYLSKKHRDLILKRHQLNHLDKVKLRGKCGQTTASYYKYKDAIAACDNQEYIEYNISQIARIFNVNSSSLANQLRRHYTDIIPRRELARQRIGITVNLQYGTRKWSKDEYAYAIKMLQTSDMTIKDVANICSVSYTGLREYVIAYYPQITSQRKLKRTYATKQKIRGKRNGNWGIHEPKQKTIEKYEKAIELYRTTSESIEKIALISGVNIGGFRHYLKQWHPELIVERRGFNTNIDLSQTKRYKKSSAEKYANAIERLKSCNIPITTAAREFGHNPQALRSYIREHCPELTYERGMRRGSNGKGILGRSAIKYSDALHLFETTTEPLKSIATKLGLTYTSLSGYIHRNHPEAIKRHYALISTIEIKKIKK